MDMHNEQALPLHAPASLLPRNVALVGRPNVGKSRLFNRLVKKKISIVHDQPGVTRDIVMAEVDQDYLLMDTGGIGVIPDMTPQDIAEATHDQVDFAIETAQVILFVCDGLDGWTHTDAIVAQKLRPYTNRVILVVNKMDLPQHEVKLGEFEKKGFGQPLALSAEHGYNIEALRELIAERLGPALPQVKVEKEITAFGFFGRPNVGKSSLSNALLGKNRLIVSPVAGTTREAIRVHFEHPQPDGQMRSFCLVDTAGLRPKAKVDSSLEYFSALRSENTLNQIDVGFLVLEAKTGITAQDKRLAGKILDAGRAFGVIVNKWDETLDAFRDQGIDGYSSEAEFRKAFEEEIRKAFFFLSDFPILFLSAKLGRSMGSILKTAYQLKQRQSATLPTAQINRVISDLLVHREPRLEQGKRFKVYYAVQVAHQPTTIRLYCNQKARLTDSYAKYLLMNFSRAFDLSGCPVKFEIVGKKKRQAL